MAKFAECDAVHLVVGELASDTVPVGAFQYFGIRPGKSPLGLHYKCPCGCGDVGTLRFRHASDSRPSWEWDGNVDMPTLKPSINHRHVENGVLTDEHWHGYLTAGKFVSV